MAQWRNEQGSFDSEGRPHSLNDIPADTRTSHDYLWYDHGNLHRDGDKFARQNKMNLSMQVWYKHDYPHRENDKPASVSSYDWKWYMEGLHHRIADAATINWMHVSSPEFREPETAKRFSQTWALYGCTIHEETFHFVMNYAKEQGCPVWVAWFYVCEIFSDEDIASLSESFSNWELPVPASWVFHMWGITHDSLTAKYRENKLDVYYHRFNERKIGERGIDEATLAVIRYESAQAETSKQLKGKDIAQAEMVTV